MLTPPVSRVWHGTLVTHIRKGNEGNRSDSKNQIVLGHFNTCSGVAGAESMFEQPWPGSG
jgi:hypothetical protein